MHDPSHLALEVRRLRLDVWHDEPGGHDAGTICGYAPKKPQELAPWLWRHRAHLHYRFWPYLSIKRWLFDHCEYCGKRFLWKQARFSNMGSDKVWHEYCGAYQQAKADRDEAYQFILDPDGMDPTARWRVGYRLDNTIGLQPYRNEDEPQ